MRPKSLSCRIASSSCSASRSWRRTRSRSRGALPARPAYLRRPARCGGGRGAARAPLGERARLAARAVEDPPAGASGAPSNAPPERAEDAIQAEEKKRAYLSLFSSNVALTYRKTPQTAHASETIAPPAAGQEPGATQLAEL